MLLSFCERLLNDPVSYRIRSLSNDRDHMNTVGGPRLEALLELDDNLVLVTMNQAVGLVSSHLLCFTPRLLQLAQSCVLIFGTCRFEIDFNAVFVNHVCCVFHGSAANRLQVERTIHRMLCGNICEAKHWPIRLPVRCCQGDLLPRHRK